MGFSKKFRFSSIPIKEDLPKRVRPLKRRQAFPPYQSIFMAGNAAFRGARHEKDPDLGRPTVKQVAQRNLPIWASEIASR